MYKVHIKNEKRKIKSFKTYTMSTLTEKNHYQL